MRRTTPARRPILAAAVVTLTAVVLAANPAYPAEAPDASPESVAALAGRLGGRSAGSYHDDVSDRLAVDVTDTAAAREVRSVGATAKVVARAGEELEGITATLAREAAIPGTAWYVDPVTNQVVVEVDDSVTGATLGRLTAVTKRFGTAVRIERTPGTLAVKLAGGDGVWGSYGQRCTVGFNVQDRIGSYYFIGAGHCLGTSTSWYADWGRSTYVGPLLSVSFPVNDYAIVRYDNPAVPRPGTVGNQDIVSAANPSIGMSACHIGMTTGLHCGTVTAVNVTVNYPQGTVSGLIRTNICAEPGDSGAPLFAGNRALGVLSGGSGNCTIGGTSYYQPVVEALTAYGVNVY